MSWPPDVIKSLDAKIDEILVIQARQLDMIVGLTERVKRIEGKLEEEVHLVLENKNDGEN